MFVAKSTLLCFIIVILYKELHRQWSWRNSYFVCLCGFSNGWEGLSYFGMNQPMFPKVFYMFKYMICRCFTSTLSPIWIKYLCNLYAFPHSQLDESLQYSHWYESTWVSKDLYGIYMIYHNFLSSIFNIRCLFIMRCLPSISVHLLYHISVFCSTVLTQYSLNFAQLFHG